MRAKDILFTIDLAEKPGPAESAAIDLAASSRAHLTGVALSVSPVVTGFVVAPVPVDLIESARAESTQVAEAATKRFADKAKRAGVEVETRVHEVLMGGIPQSFIASARLADLLIIGQENPDAPEPLRDLLIETALFEGNAPVLVVPYIPRPELKFGKVLIAWDGSRPAARAVRNALLFLEAGTAATILMVGDAAKQPGQPGADLATWLARHHLNIDIATMPSVDIPIAASILNYATDNGFDLLVMGAYGHSWVREALIGGATRDILKTMTVPVLMAH